MENKILIVYLATGVYKSCFKKFYDSLLGFCPNSEKKVVVITDDINYFSEWKDVDVSHVRPYPWPIITLFKFHYIYEIWLKYKDKGFTHVCYFNSNIIFRKVVTESEYLTDGLVAVRHWEISTYPGEFDINHYSNKNKDSVCYFENPKDYIQAGNWCCSSELIHDLCTEVMSLINTDLSHNQIPDWHDESAYNKVVIGKWIDEGRLVEIKDGTYMGNVDDYYSIEKFDSKIILDKVDKNILDFKENKTNEE